MFRSAYDETEVAVFHRRPGSRRRVLEAAVRSPAVHGRDLDRLSRDERAAAENLVPTTLELGGKSPVIVGESADMELDRQARDDGQDAERRPDLPRARLCVGAGGQGARIRGRGETAVTTMFPTLKDNPDYTSVINQRHYDRLHGLYRRREGEGRGDRRDQSGEGKLHPAALPQNSADAGPQPDRRHEDHEGRDLRPASAGEDLQAGRRSDRLCERSRPSARPLLLRHRTQRSRNRCSRARHPAA